MTKQTIDISNAVIIRVILALLAIWFLYLVRDVIALLIVSVIFVSAIEPAVDWLQKHKIPRTASVLGIYALLVAAISLSVSFLVPSVAQQFRDLSENYPVYSQKFIDFFSGVKNFLAYNHLAVDTNQVLGSFRDELAGFSRNIFSTTIGFFSGIISTIVIFSLTFYMSVEEDGIKKFVASVAPERYHKYAFNLVDRIKNKIGKWMVGQLFLMLIVFVLGYIGLTLAGVPYALLLAIFAGLMEVVPYIGPIISAIPGVVLGFLVSPGVGLLALLVYVAVQQLENHVITPQVMKKAVGLSPITVILVLLVGAKLAGVTGAILAIPVATSISLLVKDFMDYRNGARV